MKKLMMAVMVAAIGLSAAAAYTPSFAYQGVLRDQWGNPLGSDQENVGITFKIYKSANGNDYLWSKVYTVSLATNGLFNVELNGAGTSSDGASTTLDTVAADNSNEDLYVGLTVANIWATGTFYADKKATLKDGLQIEGGENGTNLTVAGSASVSGDLIVDGSAVSMPIGAIMMWAGSATANDLPKDGCWKLCDGQGTYAFNGDENDMRPIPDLRGRFIVAAVGDGTTSVTVEGESVSYATGSNGGKNNVALTADQLPSHSHGINSKGYMVDNQKDYYLYGFGWDTGKNANDPQSDGDYPKEKSKTYNTNSTGSNQAHENRPPYYALCFIIKVK